MGLTSLFKGIRQGNPNDSRYWQGDGFFRTLFQQFINKTNSNIDVSSENAFHIAAYWAAVRAISEDIAKLKVKAYTLTNNGDRKPISNNPLLKALTQGFNDETDSMTGIQTWIQWMLTFGNAYSEISYNSAGDVQFTLIHPSRVTVHRESGGGELYYHVSSQADVDKGLKERL
jgi:phage portal protein BeeE